MTGLKRTERSSNQPQEERREISKMPLGCFLDQVESRAEDAMRALDAAHEKGDLSDTDYRVSIDSVRSMLAVTKMAGETGGATPVMEAWSWLLVQLSGLFFSDLDLFANATHALADRLRSILDLESAESSI